MFDIETDHESDRINNTGGTDNDLTTDGAISLFTSALNNALDKPQYTQIEIHHLRIDDKRLCWHFDYGLRSTNFFPMTLTLCTI
jgi:hypothetical protein